MEPVRSAVTVGLDRAAAFAAFTDRIGEWWPMETHSIGRTGSVAFAGGRLVETGPDGTARYVLVAPDGSTELAAGRL